MVKKASCIILLLVILNALFSCEKAVPFNNVSVLSSTIDNKYLIFVINNTLVKINCETGNSTPLCQDTLCNHEYGKCPFSTSKSEFTVTESSNIIYFNRVSQDTTHLSDIYKYNIKAGKLMLVYEAKGQITANVSYKEDLYFIERIINIVNSVEKAYCDIYKIGSDNIAVKLNNEELDPSLNIEKVKDDRIYMFTYPDFIRFNTTINFTDKTETSEINLENGFDYEIIDNKDKLRSYVIKSEKDNKGNRVLISDQSGLYFEIGEYIYYQKYLDKKKYITTNEKNGKQIYTEFESKLYRSKYDGSENRVFCDFGDHLNPSYSKYVNYSCLIDDYILIEFDKYAEDKYGQLLCCSEYAVLNYKTGEYKMVS